MPQWHPRTSFNPVVLSRNLCRNREDHTPNTNIQINGDQAFGILKDAIAHRAFHNSAARFDPPKCHPNTRVAVLNKIIDWLRRCDNETRDRFIMWLTGAAGASKSSIAQSFIELCLSLSSDLVLASFFFGRADETRNHAGTLIATLVYQIYHALPNTQVEILSGIAANPLIFTKTLEHQFTELLAKPLDKIFSVGRTGNFAIIQPYRVIVLDGLDECIDRMVQVQGRILRMISSLIRQYDLHIIFLIASRLEHDINVVLPSREMADILTRLYLDDVYEPNEDIRTFLEDSFDQIRNDHPFEPQIPTPWPPHGTIQSLVHKSSGQFVYATAIVRYVESPHPQPHHRLDVVMDLRPPQGDLPFA